MDVKSAGVWAVLVSAVLVVFVLVFVLDSEAVEEEPSGISKYEVIARGNLPLPLLLWPTMIQIFRSFVPFSMSLNAFRQPSILSCFFLDVETKALSDNVLYGALG